MTPVISPGIRTDFPVGSSGRAGVIARRRRDGFEVEQGFVHQATPGVGPGDWILYRHWDPPPDSYGPVRDFYAYNGGGFPAENEVVDLGLTARLTVTESVERDLGGAPLRLRPVRSACPGPAGRRDRAGA